MAQDGIYWFIDPDVIAQKFSAAAASMGPKVGLAVSRTVDEAAEIMRTRILTGGQKNRVLTGGPRIRSGAMFNAVGSKMSLTSGGRAQGQYGYINDPPYWTIFQEDGTRNGIIPLHALQLASETARRNMAEQVSRVNIWSNFR